MSRQFGGAPSRGNNNKTMIVAALGVLAVLLLGLLAALIFAGGGEEGATQQAVVLDEVSNEVKKVEVLIPIRQIETGSELKPTMFRVEMRPSVGLDEGVVTSFDQIQGQYSKFMIVQNRPLHRDYVTPLKPLTLISSEIPKGYRAVSITVNKTSSVEGWAVPGSRVDVSVTAKRRGVATITKIVQNAKVLSSDRQTNGSNPGLLVPSTVTLLVTERDSQAIQLASTAGELTLSLRGDADTGAVDGNSATTTIEQIMNVNSGKVAKRRGPTSRGTITIDGQRFILNADGSKTPLGGGPSNDQE